MLSSTNEKDENPINISCSGQSTPVFHRQAFLQYGTELLFFFKLRRKGTQKESELRSTRHIFHRIRSVVSRVEESLAQGSRFTLTSIVEAVLRSPNLLGFGESIKTFKL